MTAILTDKEAALVAISRLPADAPMAEVLDQLKLLTALREGEQAIADGRVVPHEEVERRYAAWLKN